MTSCPHCGSSVTDTARICRSCGRIIDPGSTVETSEAPVIAPKARSSGAVPRSPAGDGAAIRCQICDVAPVMIQQVERNSPVVPGVMGFVGLLVAVMGLSWHSWGVRLFLLAVSVGIWFAAYRILTAERRYWLCPKCGDTEEISG